MKAKTKRVARPREAVLTRAEINRIAFRAAALKIWELGKGPIRDSDEVFILAGAPTTTRGQLGDRHHPHDTVLVPWSPKQTKLLEATLAGVIRILEEVANRREVGAKAGSSGL